jgi:hypothetical protein
MAMDSSADFDFARHDAQCRTNENISDDRVSETSI